MRRLLLIARREYLAYARTVGFWLSLLSLPLFAVLGGGAVSMIERSGGAREAVVIDLTLPVEGQVSAGDALTQALAAGRADTGRRRGSITVVPAEGSLSEADDPAQADAAARAAVEGEGPLDAVVILVPEGEAVAARVWSARAGDDRTEGAVRAALTQVNRSRALAAMGVDPAAIEQIDQRRPTITALSPQSASGAEVGLQDRMPGLIGFILGMTLWSLIVTGASILLNSVMEEKANRVLEVLLASASATEVLAGKVLGVALVTLTVLAAWGVFGAIGLSILGQNSPEIVQALSASIGGLLRGGLWLWLVAYFLGGYLMYAVMFAAIGSFCETPRDAQTLIGPIMMALIVPIFVMQLAIRDPDLSLVRTLSWVPFFTPFLMSARAPSGPPLIELAGTLAVMLATTAAVVWLAGRAFRAGALSTGKFDWKALTGLVRGGA